MWSQCQHHLKNTISILGKNRQPFMSLHFSFTTSYQYIPLPTSTYHFLLWMIQKAWILFKWKADYCYSTHNATITITIYIYSFSLCIVVKWESWSAGDQVTSWSIQPTAKDHIQEIHQSSINLLIHPENLRLSTEMLDMLIALDCYGGGPWTNGLIVIHIYWHILIF